MITLKPWQGRLEFQVAKRTGGMKTGNLRTG